MEDEKDMWKEEEIASSTHLLSNDCDVPLLQLHSVGIFSCLKTGVSRKDNALVLPGPKAGS